MYGVMSASFFWFPASGKGDHMIPEEKTTDEPPVVTPAGGLEGPETMVTSKAPPLGAPVQKAEPVHKGAAPDQPATKPHEAGAKSAPSHKS
jgi:hypothetical protein